MMHSNVIDPMTAAQPIGDLTVAYLKRCGYAAETIITWTNETRLLHDLGLCGDDILDEFAVLSGEFDVDLAELDLDKYFPSEHSGDAFIRSVLCWSLSELANLILYGIDAERGTLMVWLGKGWKERLVPLAGRKLRVRGAPTAMHLAGVVNDVDACMNHRSTVRRQTEHDERVSDSQLRRL